MSRTTRRQFAKTLTAAGAALAVADLAAQEKEKETPPNQLGLALTAVTRAQFGQHLSEDEMTQVGKDWQDYAPYI